jgi:hypothetical protein
MLDGADDGVPAAAKDIRDIRVGLLHQVGEVDSKDALSTRELSSLPSAMPECSSMESRRGCVSGRPRWQGARPGHARAPSGSARLRWVAPMSAAPARRNLRSRGQARSSSGTILPSSVHRPLHLEHEFCRACCKKGEARREGNRKDARGISKGRDYVVVRSDMAAAARSRTRT